MKFRVAELEDEKGNLQLKVVEMEEQQQQQGSRSGSGSPSQEQDRRSQPRQDELEAAEVLKLQTGENILMGLCCM